jgi:hypothetical protein
MKLLLQPVKQRKRGVAQSGLEYTSGGRVVAGSNPVTPTKTVAAKGSRFSFSTY